MQDSFARFMSNLERLRSAPRDCAAWCCLLELANGLGAYEEVLACASPAQQCVFTYASAEELLPLSLQIRAEVAYALLCGRRDPIAAWEVLCSGRAAAASAHAGSPEIGHRLRAEIDWVRSLCARRRIKPADRSGESD